MRNIKFRQWLGAEFHYWGGNICPYDFVSPATANRINASNTVHQQFTGLLDKNGKEIYEGDIVVNGLSGTWIIEPLEQGSFGLLGVCNKYKDVQFIISALNDHVEVIGNIYENPELLEGK